MNCNVHVPGEPGPGSGGGTPLFGLTGYVWPDSVWFSVVVFFLSEMSSQDNQISYSVEASPQAEFLLVFCWR